MGFFRNMIEADRNNERADKINITAFERMQESKAKQQEAKEKMENSFEKLANRKKGILMTSMKSFLDIFDKIMKIDFERGDDITEILSNNITSQVITEAREMSVNASSYQLTDGQSFATFIKGGISGIIRKDSEINLSVAKMRRKQADVLETQSEIICIAMNNVTDTLNKVSDILAKLNIVFMKSIKTCDLLIEENGTNRLNYSKADKEKLMTCINIASAIKQILDTKLINENGELTEQSVQAISIGDECLKKINETINM